ncbi:MAG: tetratricopeptide repeat protein [Pseudomonadota bacterium]
MTRFLERRRVVQARPLLATALARFPDDVGILTAAAYLESLARNPEESARWCRAALEIDPESERARYLLAEACSDIEDYDTAEVLYQSLIRDYPEDVDYLACFALLLFRTVHHSRGHTLANHAMALDPKNRLAQQAAFAAALLTGDRKRADAIMESAMNDDPDSMLNARTLLALLEERHEYVDALHLSRLILQAEPDNEENVRSVIELQHKGHWSMWPLRWIDEPLGFASGAGFVGIGLLAWDAVGTAGKAIGGLAVLFSVYLAVWPIVFRKYLER